MLDRRQTERPADRLFTLLAAMEKRIPAHERSRQTNLQAEMEEAVEHNAFLGELIPGYIKAYHIAYRGQASRESVVVVAAVLRYRLARGHVPDTLDELIRQGYLSHFVTDPFTGSPLVYRRVGRDFLLYSLGPDFDDDGGIRDRPGEEFDGDDVFWPPEDD